MVDDWVDLTVSLLGNSVKWMFVEKVEMKESWMVDDMALILVVLMVDQTVVLSVVWKAEKLVVLLVDLLFVRKVAKTEKRAATKEMMFVVLTDFDMVVK